MSLPLQARWLCSRSREEGPGDAARGSGGAAPLPGPQMPMRKMRQCQRTPKFISNTQRSGTLVRVDALSVLMAGKHHWPSDILPSAPKRHPWALHRASSSSIEQIASLQAGTEGVPSKTKRLGPRQQAAWQKAGLGRAKEAPGSHSALASAPQNPALHCRERAGPTTQGPGMRPASRSLRTQGPLGFTPITHNRPSRLGGLFVWLITSD